MQNDQFSAIMTAINNNSNLNKVGAQGGTTYYGIGAATGLSAVMLQPRESTVFTVITGKTTTGATVDMLALFGVSGITLGTIDLLIAPAGYVITAFTTSSGSVLVYS